MAGALALILAGMGLMLVVASKKPSPSASSSPAVASSASPLPAGSDTPVPSASALTPADLGVDIQTMTQEAAREMGVTFRRGARVTSVVPEKPASRAGLQANDVITFLGRHPILESDDVVANLAKRKRGDAFFLGLVRQGKPRWLRVRVPASP